MRSALLRSTPFRLTAILGVAFLVSLLIAASAAYWLIRQELDARLDSGILAAIAVITQAYGENGENDITDLVDTVNSHAHASPDHNDVYLLRDASGAALAGNLTSATVVPGWSTVPASSIGLPKDRSQFRVHLSQVGQYSLLVGSSFAETDAIGALVLSSIGWAGALFLVLVVAAGTIVAIRGQRRLDGIAQTMHRVGRGELDARIKVSGRNDDIDTLADEMNGALDRLGAVVEGIRQVSVDIAHDLKTPLNRLGITMEGAIDAEEQGQAVAPLLKQAQEESRQINATFDALLRIAHLEAGARRSRFTRLNVAPILDTIAEAYGEVAKESGQRLKLERCESLPDIVGDQDLLTQLFANLVENAIRHCPAKTAIVIKSRPEPERLVVTVSDTGPGIPDAEHDKVFRRLYRVEKSRTTPGSGLGLSLVKAIVDLHGGTISLCDGKPGLVVTLAFPIAGATILSLHSPTAVESGQNRNGR